MVLNTRFGRAKAPPLNTILWGIGHPVRSAPTSNFSWSRLRLLVHPICCHPVSQIPCLIRAQHCMLLRRASISSCNQIECMQCTSGYLVYQSPFLLDQKHRQHCRAGYLHSTIKVHSFGASLIREHDYHFSMNWRRGSRKCPQHTRE